VSERRTTRESRNERRAAVYIRFGRRGGALCELIAIDEVGDVPLAEVGAELLFQIIADRTEQAAVILTTNLPFSEWTQVIPNARLCKALLDRITDRAHIIETGTESYRFRRTLEKRKKKTERPTPLPQAPPLGAGPAQRLSLTGKSNCRRIVTRRGHPAPSLRGARFR
jgi:hypothetical protein